MADNATITVNDGASTPVAHAFSPTRIVGDVASYQNKVADAVVGRESLAVRLSSSKAVRTTKIDLRVPRLVEETINGVATYRVNGFLTAKADVIVPLDFTADEAKNGRIMLSNLLAHATIGLMVDENEFVW